MQYTIKCDNITAICNSVGAELVSLKNADSIEYIWQSDTTVWAEHNPVLFPVVGRTINDTVYIDGKPYNIGLHGFASKSKFEVISQSERSITFQLKDSPETFKNYPFHFSLCVTHSVTENGYVTEFSVTNTGEANMPFCIGAHPGFNCDGDFRKWRVVFEKYEDAWAYILNAKNCLSENDREHTLNNTDTLYLDHSIFDRVDTLHFKDLKSESVRLLDSSDHGIKVDFGGFPMLGLWTAVNKNAPYICIEPWHGCGAFEDETGELNDKPYCICLAPGENKTLSYKVTII